MNYEFLRNILVAYLAACTIGTVAFFSWRTK